MNTGQIDRITGDKLYFFGEGNHLRTVSSVRRGGLLRHQVTQPINRDLHLGIL
jgi:hypothetical protein